MKLTPENKAVIDGKTYLELLRGWRFLPAGDPWFQGETGEYWGQRMYDIGQRNPEMHTRVSKQVGWE